MTRDGTSNRFTNSCIWIVALCLPILAGVITWVWTGATTSVASCQSGGETDTGAVAWALVVVSPLMTGAYAWRTHTARFRLTVAALAAEALTFVSIFLADQIWSISHNCIGSIIS